jgi:hypothetical protein
VAVTYSSKTDRTQYIYNQKLNEKEKWFQVDVKVLWHVIWKNKKESLFCALLGEVENEVSNGFDVWILAHFLRKNVDSRCLLLCWFKWIFSSLE